MLNNPLLEGYLTDFRGGFEYWKTAPAQERYTIAKKLKNIAFDICFVLGRPKEAPANVLTTIDNLFCAAADVLRRCEDQRIKDIATHLAQRAEKLMTD